LMTFINHPCSIFNAIGPPSNSHHIEWFVILIFYGNHLTQRIWYCPPFPFVERRE
jgi:hypothetical protein